MLEFRNKLFAIADDGPGEAEDWTLNVNWQNPGFAKFEQFGGFTVEERFEWYDSYPGVWSGVEPFNMDISHTQLLSSVDPAQNYFELVGDVRRLLPSLSCFQIVGTVPGQTNLDAYWQVLKTELVGGMTRIFPTENILVDVPANIIIPPIIYVNADNYGWGARSTSQASYPVAALGAGETLILSINRGDDLTIAFAGGETSAQDVVDRINAEFVSAVVDDQVEAAVVGGVPVIRTRVHSVGQYIEVKGGTSATTLLFETFEQYGFGQFAQLFSGFFDDPSAATAEETAEVINQYVQHGDTRPRYSLSGGSFRVEAEKAGANATCQVWGYNGDVMSNATWPIPARGPGSDQLSFVLNGVTVSATLTNGATTAEEIQVDIINAIASAGAEGFTWIADNGQLVVGGATSMEVTGGDANPDLAFPTHVVLGSNKFNVPLGFTSEISVGKDDVGFFSEFDDVEAFVASFAEGTAQETTAEAFEWRDVFESMDTTNTAAGEFKSWAEWLNRGTIAGVNTVDGKFTILGEKADYFFIGSHAMVQGSTGNDRVYNVTAVIQGGGQTTITVAEDVTSAVVDGEIYPLFYPIEADDLEQGWQSTFLTNPADPPFGFNRGSIVGQTVAFPLRVWTDQSSMWIYISSETDLINIIVDAGTYDTAADLLSVMNTKLGAASSADLIFSVHEENAAQTSARIGFGWDGTGIAAEEFYFVNEAGRYADRDIRETIGLVDFGGPAVKTRIKVPSKYFAKVQGSGHIRGPELWESDPRQFEVDPDSRISYTITTTPATEIVALPEAYGLALFNTLVGGAGDDSANEDFMPETWSGSLVDLPTFEGGLVVATFDTDLTPEDVEDFEEGWA